MTAQILHRCANNPLIGDQSNLNPDVKKNEKNKILTNNRYKENNFNVIASDLIGLNRNLSDFRPER